MSGSIRLHPKHGVNPTLGVCFFCGKEDGTIGLLGFNKDREAPKHSIISAEPCDACKANWAKGIVLIECEDHEAKGCIQIAPNTWATGRWIVMADQWVQRVIASPLREQILKTRKSFIDKEMFDQLQPRPSDKEPA